MSELDKRNELSAAQVEAMLLGAATGDAFRVPFEFLLADEIAQYSLDTMRGSDDETPVNSHWGRKSLPEPGVTILPWQWLRWNPLSALVANWILLT